MDDPRLMAPLAEWQGRPPPAPEWFTRAISCEPERSFIEVEGAQVEALAWGERGRRGLILLHGGAAHADWWSFIAPFFQRDYRAVALTFTGMGRSDWRAVYQFSQFVREAHAAARAAGAFDAGPPFVVGHSFGARVAMGLASEFGRELAAAALVDPPFFAPDAVRTRNPPRPTKKRGPHPSLASLVARFRLAPAQPCDNLYILDFIARHSARELLDEEGRRGWRLSFDPQFWDHFEHVDPAPLLKGARCPLALMRGERSRLFGPRDAAYLMSLIEADAPYIEIPEAEHHVMIDQPLAFVAALRALIAAWPAAAMKNKL